MKQTTTTTTETDFHTTLIAKINGKIKKKITSSDTKYIDNHRPSIMIIIIIIEHSMFVMQNKNKQTNKYTV